MGKIVSDAVGVRSEKREEEAVYSGVLICQTLTAALEGLWMQRKAMRHISVKYLNASTL